MQELGALFKQYPILLQEPGRILNLDETPLEYRAAQNRKEKVVVATVDDHTPAPIRPAPEDANTGHITFIGTVTGDGKVGPSAYLVNHAGVDTTWFQEPQPYGWPAGCRNGLDHIFVTANDSGCMKHDEFEDFFTDVLLPFQKQRFSSGPLLFLFDGPTCHGAPTK